jgi:hypothetical protein
MSVEALLQPLIDALWRLPLADSEAGRNTLVAGIPSAEVLAREAGNAQIDITLLVRQLANNFGPAGEWRLLSLIDNAVPTVAGTELAATLKRLRAELIDAVRAIKPADVAQVHLFDLREAVTRCAATLPSDGGVSGFVVPGATPKLLRYFCESLRHRGVELDVWTRDRVAPTNAPLVIGPLQITVPAAVTNAAKYRQLLSVKHVLWPVFVDHPGDAESLWQGVVSLFDKPPARNMVVVLGMPRGNPHPAGMAALPEPVFTRQHISVWVGQIAKTKKWDAALVERWTGVIVTHYQQEPSLPVDYVYERLEQYHMLISENRDNDDALLQALTDLELIGE